MKAILITLAGLNLIVSRAHARGVVDYVVPCEGGQSLVKVCAAGPRPPCDFTLNGRQAWVRGGYTNGNHLYTQARYGHQTFDDPYVVCEVPGGTAIADILAELVRSQ